VGDDIFCLSSLYHYWSYFESMQGTAFTLRFSDYQAQAHKIVCGKDGLPMPLKRYILQSPLFPGLAEFLCKQVA